jgi:hypothetical protein
MLPKTHSQDSNFEWDQQAMLDAYKEAAAADDFMFGDCDYSYIWMDNKSNDVY